MYTAPCPCLCLQLSLAHQRPGSPVRQSDATGIRPVYVVCGLRTILINKSASTNDVRHSPDPFLLKLGDHRLQGLGLHFRIQQLEASQVAKLLAVQIRGHFWTASVSTCRLKIRRDVLLKAWSSRYGDIGVSEMGGFEDSSILCQTNEVLANRPGHRCLGLLSIC